LLHTVSSDHYNEFEMWKRAVVKQLVAATDQGNSQKSGSKATGGSYGPRKLVKYEVNIVGDRKARFEVAVARINLKERDHLGDPGVDGRKILRWIFRKWEGVVGTGWSWLRIGTGGGHL